MATSASNLVQEIAEIVGADHVLSGDAAEARYALTDATVSQGLIGTADAVALPADRDEVVALVAFCSRAGVPLTPRGGGTGYAGGAVPRGGVVVDLTRLNAIREFTPELWRIHAEAGVRTATLHRRARETGLMFPPDPGAAEDSTIGGNIATNAGGPHAFKYGSTGAWVTGIEAVVPPGRVITVGGPFRKDVAGYDLMSLLVGSEGTLGVITAAWLRLIPAPETTLPVAAFYRDTPSGCAAIERVLGYGVRAAALEYLDAGALAIAGPGFPGTIPPEAGFLVIGEADGTPQEAQRIASELTEALTDDALGIKTFPTRSEARDLWRWRDGVSLAVTGHRGGKLSEDIVVPLDRLRAAIEGTAAIGDRRRLSTCSWGHAGDGNLHSSFLIDPADPSELDSAKACANELFELALELGGSISGEHGVGLVKNGYLGRQWSSAAVSLHRGVKAAFDPEDVLNPGKKLGDEH